jgi:hypothetical protein
MLALAAGADSAHLDIAHFVPVDYSAPSYDLEVSNYTSKFT